MDPNFHFPNPKTTVPRERFVQRLLEMVPGTLSLATLFGMLALSLFQPIVAAVFIITFDIYWIYRTIFVSYYSLKGHFTLREGKKINWWERCQNIEKPSVYAEMIRDRIRGYREALSEVSIFKVRDILVLRKWIWQTEVQLKEVEALIPIQKEILDWRQIIHVVLLPTAGESAEIIEPAIQSLLDVIYLLDGDRLLSIDF
jgi:hypothetical protein